MNSKIEIPSKEKFVLRFPCLARYKKEDLVVLFTDKHVGTVIHSSGKYDIGHYDITWAPIDDGDTWEICEKGTRVILEV